MFHYVIIETTGLANPGPVAAALWTDAELEAAVCLDCIITVADCRNLRRQLAEPPGEGGTNEAQQQLAYAGGTWLTQPRPAWPACPACPAPVLRPFDPRASQTSSC